MDATEDRAIQRLARDLMDRMRDIEHLNVVLRRKNRTLRGQHAALKSATRRIDGLLGAIDSIRASENMAQVDHIVRCVLRYDERRAQPEARFLAVDPADGIVAPGATRDA